ITYIDVSISTSLMTYDLDDLLLLFFPTRRSSDLRDRCRDGASHAGRRDQFRRAVRECRRPQRLLRSEPQCLWPSTFTYSSSKLRSEEHTSELQSRFDLVCRLLLDKKNSTVDIYMA